MYWVKIKFRVMMGELNYVVLYIQRCLWSIRRKRKLNRGETKKMRLWHRNNNINNNKKDNSYCFKDKLPNNNR